MITVPTVLVLGAGASIPFGFPSGRELLISINRQIAGPSSQLGRHLMELGFRPEHIQDFGRSLFYSGQPSVDAFLEHRGEFVEVGKAAIACALIPYETPEKLYHRFEHIHWYEYLYAQLDTSPDRFPENKLGVITFNYDRSLEAFLVNALQHTYGISESAAAAMLSSLPIIHVHGQLGALRCLSSDGEGRPYEPTVDSVALQKCIQEIKIIHEAPEEDTEFARARDTLSKAQRICFLGFGYHPANIERLGVLEVTGRPMHGSAYGLADAEQQQVISRMRGRISLGLRHDDCLGYLRHEFALK